MASDNDQAWEQRLRRSTERARQWTDYTSKLQDVEPGSVLAGDNKQFAPYPLGHAAWFGISSAVDHLGLMIDAIDGSRISRPYAYFTVARAATLGAAKTVWMLSPDKRDERCRRGLHVAYEDYRRHRQTAASLPVRKPDERARQREYVSRLDEAMAEIRGAGEVLQPTFHNDRPTDTDVINDCADQIQAKEGLGQLAVMLRMMWRVYSGHAHSLPWANMGRYEFDDRREQGGPVVGVVSASISDIGSAVALSTQMIDIAIGLFEKRRKNHLTRV